MVDNRKLITTEIEHFANEIKKIDTKILKEIEPLKQGSVIPKTLEKLATLRIEREKLLHTQTAFYAILGQWKDE